MSINLTHNDLDRIRSVNSLEVLELFRAERPDTIRILAEGDSWFAYPRQYLVFGDPSNIVDHLKKKDNLVITDISSNGDEALQMITGDAKLDFLDRVSSGNYDIILFSGGGNDIAGEHDFDFFLRTKKEGMSWRDCIDETRLTRRLGTIRNAYIDLIELVEFACIKTSVKVPPIITHTYDLAVPSKKGASFVAGIFKVDGGRSWMLPYMEQAGITAQDDQRQIVRYILERFANILIELSADYPNSRFRVVDTRGTLREEEWLNEIHPSPDGFGKIASRIYDKGIMPTIQQLLIER